MSSSDYSLEELLLLIEEETEPEKAPDLPSKSKISDFISEYNIRSGVDRTCTHVIYYTYKEKYGGDLSKVEFFRQFKKEGFIQRRTGKQRVYLLDSSSFDMSEEGLLEAEFHNRRKK